MDKKNLLPQANASVISTTTTKEKRSLVFMNNFYHKVAIASVGIALGFALGTHREAKAATFTFTETSRYNLRDPGDLPDLGNTGASLAVGIREPKYNPKEDYRAFYEFNIARLLGDPNIVISSAILETNISNIRWYRPHSKLQAYGYTENDKVDYQGVYNAGAYLDQLTIGELSVKRIAPFDVLPFITQRIGSNNSFAGFSIRSLNGEGFVNLDLRAYLIITTEATDEATERVPEPTTLFGSAIGLCLGGWLKRRKSALQKKTTS
jgi:hypothetical protein